MFHSLGSSAYDQKYAKYACKYALKRTKIWSRAEKYYWTYV